VKDSSLPPLFCECLLLWAWLRATQQAMPPDWLLPPLSCDRPSFLARQQGTLQAQATQRFRLVMRSLQLSCAHDVLRATHPGWAIELG